MNDFELVKVVAAFYGGLALGVIIKMGTTVISEIRHEAKNK